VILKRSEVNLVGVDKKDFKVRELNALVATMPSGTDLKIKRENEYTAPAHNARITNVYSVSLPVCILWSQ
jgi:hypothetical protein